LIFTKQKEEKEQSKKEKSRRRRKNQMEGLKLEELKLDDEDLHRYIKKKFTCLQPLPSLLDALSMEMELKGRTKAINFLREQLCKYTDLQKRTRSGCHILVMAGAPGLGKTKLLLCLSQFEPFRDYRYVVITYNNGHEPTPFDYDYPGARMVLRFLYFGFEPKGEGSNFKAYYDQMSTRFGESQLKQLDMTTVLSLLPDDNLTILGVDEFNYMLLDKHSTDPVQYRSALKMIVVALGNAMVSSKSRLFPILAGTAMEPLSVVIAESSHPHDPVPLGLLTLDDLMEISCSLKWLPQEWKTCDTFQRVLATMGGLPRIIEYFLRQCKSRVEERLSMKDWPWIDMMSAVRNEAKGKYLITSHHYTRTLLVDAILEQTVERNEVVLGDLKGMTYGQLERIGSVILVQREEKLYVALPLVLLNELLVSSPPTLPNETEELQSVWQASKTRLRKLFRPREDDLLPWIDWESFEQFLVEYDAVRTSLSYYRKALLKEDPQCLLDQLYPIDHGNVTTKNLCDNTSIVLEARETLRLTHRFPSSEGKLKQAALDLVANCTGKTIPPKDWYKYVFSPASGGVADYFSFHKTTTSKLLVIGQAKRYVKVKLNAEKIHEEASKAKKAFGGCGIPYVLIIFSTLACPISNEEMPDNCLFLGGDHLRQFLGRALADQAKVIVQTQEGKVNVNTASKDELILSLYRIGKGRAEFILRSRISKPFIDWNDLKSRFASTGDVSLPSVNESRVCF